MKLVSVNIGKAQPIRSKSGQSGIYKRSAAGAVQVARGGLVSDTICDTDNHGGVDQAVYLYGLPDYAWWSKTLGRDLEPGTFGENLTISELESAHLQVGDRFVLGDEAAGVVLEVTAPRIPCATLAARMDDLSFVKRFRHAERPGVYCRVLQEGQLQVGDAVTFTPFTGETLGVLEMFRTFYEPHRDEATLRRHLAAPIAIRDRVAKEAELERLVQGRTS